ncbi:hypothetical protein K227x_62800 [Rubripirellula lacrimiformis]|uniref:Chromosome partition protein Smc n=1 Tax=Rubripirellula lacrimiformis TaxID=1930273 RepID=A0A517NL51_9BACT|nr:hypothetical protein [Rubripirellula lacrimiformis]QDT07851.1 hypothetical protein K227x_62800 [Rubripirellula lacrimiformis]
MPISGPVVHQQLMDAYTQTQSRLESMRNQVGKVDQHREQLDDQRSDALVKLAEYYLPELTPDAIRETWAEVRPSIAQVFRRQENKCQQLNDQITRLAGQRQLADAELIKINQELDASIDSHEQLSKQVEEQLRRDETFVRLSERAGAAEAALERAEANLNEIEQDAAKKLPAYENSSLFTYLRDRQFGTPQYASRGFTRRMDRWVAKMIDFQTAKQGYDFLRKTPEQMRRIIADDRNALDTVMGELERHRDQVATNLGLPASIERSQSIALTRDQHLNRFNELMADTNQAERELTTAADSQGPFYHEAIGLFRDMLKHIDSGDLRRRAQDTIDLSDDQIVAQLMDVEAKIGSLSEATQRHHTQTNQMQSFLEDMGRLIQQFRSAGFDSSRSQFVGTLDISSELNRAIDAGDAEMLWNAIRSAQRWGPTVMEQVTAVAAHPMTQVLINAMAHAAGGALQEHARRAGQRRGRKNRQWSSSWDSSWGSSNRRSPW